jgi:hypothetical protein
MQTAAISTKIVVPNTAQATQRDWLYTASLTLIICTGIFLRANGYLHNPSLWLDEAGLALNILDRNFLELAAPLDYTKASPLLFLWAEKLASVIFGPSELSLRFFPFICGCLSIPLMLKVARQYLSKWTALGVTALFACSDPLIHFSSELKHHGTDLFFALSILYTFQNYYSKRTFKTAMFFAAVGAVALWFSFPALFLLIGMTVCLLGSSRTFSDLRSRLALISAWAVSYASLYAIQFSHLSGQLRLLDNYGIAAFAPAEPGEFFSWLPHALDEFSHAALGQHMPLLVLALSLIGLASMIKKQTSSAFILGFPILLTVVLSRFHLYPVVGRLLLFLVPSVLILMGTGIERITAGIERLHLNRSFTLFLFVALMWQPIKTADHFLHKPRFMEEIRPIFLYLKDNWRANDSVFVYRGSQTVFRYYQKLYDWTPTNIRWDNDSIPECSYPYFRQFSYAYGTPRAWLLQSGSLRKRAEQRQMTLDYLKGLGAVTEEQHTFKADLYLFDFTKPHSGIPAL